MRAAVWVNQALAEAQASISVSIGIDYGRFLMIPDKDCYGDPVNIAYKLGEDVARPGEILITAAAHSRCGTTAARCTTRSTTITVTGA